MLCFSVSFFLSHFVYSMLSFSFRSILFYSCNLITDLLALNQKKKYFFKKIGVCKALSNDRLLSLSTHSFINYPITLNIIYRLYLCVSLESYPVHQLLLSTTWIEYMLDLIDLRCQTHSLLFLLLTSHRIGANEIKSISMYFPLTELSFVGHTFDWNGHQGAWIFFISCFQANSSYVHFTWLFFVVVVV